MFFEKTTPPREQLVFLGTGGTIAGLASQAADTVGYRAGLLDVAQLLAALPDLPERLGGCQAVAEQVANLDSKDMSFAVWQQLAARCAHWLAQPQVRGLVITHGSDTLEETAWLLQCVLQPAKPVVLTCAMRPASALNPDGPQNLLDAASVALDGRWPGQLPVASPLPVCVVCAGQVHSARYVQKLHPYRLDAFGSGQAGPLAVVEQGAVRWLNAPVQALACGPDDSCRPSERRCGYGVNSRFTGVPAAPPTIKNRASDEPWPRVEIVMNHAGASGHAVRALVQSGVQGLIVAGTGNASLHHELEAALLAAQRAGVWVWRTTRCAQGQVVLGPGSAPALPATALPPVKARVSMLLALRANAGQCVAQCTGPCVAQCAGHRLCAAKENQAVNSRF